MTKFQYYIKRYGCAMNFYGGTGKSAHKIFVKTPGQKTQRRVSEFASQTASQFSNILVTNHTLRSIGTNCNSIRVHCNSDHVGTNQSIDGDDAVSVELCGKYSLVVTNDVIKLMMNDNDIYVAWNLDKKKVKKNKKHYCIDKDLVRVIMKEMRQKCITEFGEGYKIKGYAQATASTQDGNRVIFYRHPYFQGRMWYDWAYVHFEEINSSGDAVENYYPSKILGFITISGTTEAVIQCSEKSLTWSDLENKFFVKTIIGTDMDVSYITVPISALVHPLCVIPDYGGRQMSYTIVLPKQNWSRYFGDKIQSEYNKSLEE